MNKRERIAYLEQRIEDLERSFYGEPNTSLPRPFVPRETPIIVVPGHFDHQDVLRTVRTGENMVIEHVISHHESPPMTKARICRGIGSVVASSFTVRDEFVKVANMRNTPPSITVLS